MDSSISVVIPFFRRQHTFAETLETALAQTHKADEIIVVDDASGGDALEFLKGFEPDIRVVALEENVGVSGARNIGVREATGHWIAFLDSDDLWHQKKLENQLAYLRAKPDCDVIHTGTVNFYPDGREIEYVGKPSRLSKADLAQSSHVMFQSVMMRRKDFLSLDGFDQSFRQTEDYEFSMRMVRRGLKIDFLPEPLVRIRHGHADKLSTNWKGFISGHIRVVLRHKQLFREVDGWLGPAKHCAKYLIKGGYKKGGLAGRLITLTGRLLYPAYKG
ncbi:MAG: glycosyltransferase family 2 protein [Pseudomonadota bacterium]